jgi:CheY-like chemotaxis protein
MIHDGRITIAKAHPRLTSLMGLFVLRIENPERATSWVEVIFAGVQGGPKDNLCNRGFNINKLTMRVRSSSLGLASCSEGQLSLAMVLCTMQYSLLCIYSCTNQQRRLRELGAGTCAPFVYGFPWAGRHFVENVFIQRGQDRPCEALAALHRRRSHAPTLRKKVLEQNGYIVIGVTTAADALKVLREAPVCAIIADHMLQEATGTEFANEMKKIKPDVPIILFSGNIPQHLKGVDVYVNKGEPTPTFLNIVREVVRRSCS